MYTVHLARCFTLIEYGGHLCKFNSQILYFSLRCICLTALVTSYFSDEMFFTHFHWVILDVSIYDRLKDEVSLYRLSKLK